MNKTTIAEVNRLKQTIPSKGRVHYALFTINRTSSGYEVEVIVSNHFGFMPEAIRGDEKHLVSDDSYEFDTITDAMAFIEEQRGKYGTMPILGILGIFTKAEMEQIRATKNVLLLNSKYLAFLYGIEVKKEYETKIID